MPKPESLYHKYPDYRVELEPASDRIVVTLGDETIADSERAVRIIETRHAPVLYFPRQDVRMDRLERSEQRSFCPFKGEASYWSIRAGDQFEESAVWSYEDPFDQGSGLKDYVSFYQDRPNLKQAGA